MYIYIYIYIDRYIDNRLILLFIIYFFFFFKRKKNSTLTVEIVELYEYLIGD